MCLLLLLSSCCCTSYPLLSMLAFYVCSLVVAALVTRCCLCLPVYFYSLVVAALVARYCLPTITITSTTLRMPVPAATILSQCDYKTTMDTDFVLIVGHMRTIQTQSNPKATTVHQSCSSLFDGRIATAQPDELKAIAVQCARPAFVLLPAYPVLPPLSVWTVHYYRLIAGHTTAPVLSYH